MPDPTPQVIESGRSEWLLLVIAAGGVDGLTPVQLQKTVFLLGDKCRDLVGENFYKFKPWDYGPFDVGVCGDARKLLAEGLVTISHDLGKGWNIYRITRKGVGIAQSLRPRLPAVAVDYVRTVVDWAKALTFTELVRAIFKAYPEMAKNAVFQGAH